MSDIGNCDNMASVGNASEPRTAIIVLGMHRSGTSALTRVISFLGGTLPRNLLGARRGNMEGHWEPQNLVELNDKMLAEAGSRWDDWLPFSGLALSVERYEYYRKKIGSVVEEEYGVAETPLLKDPRICRFPQLYKQVFEDQGRIARFIIPLRNPLAVAASLAARDGMSEGFAALVWLRHVLTAEFETRGTCRAFVCYEDLLQDWRPAIEQILHKLQLDWSEMLDTAQPDISGYLSADLQHQKFSASDLKSGPNFAEWIREAYFALCRLVESDGQPEVFETLDRIRRQFDDFADIFAKAVLPELHIREERDASERRALSIKVSSLEAHLRNGDGKFKTANVESQAPNDEDNSVSIAEQKIKAEMENLSSIVAMRDLEVARLTSLASSYKNKIDDHKKENQRVRRVYGEKLRTNSLYQEDLINTINQIRSSNSWRLTKPIRYIAKIGKWRKKLSIR